jgi:hypothetical protein
MPQDDILRSVYGGDPSTPRPRKTKQKQRVRALSPEAVLEKLLPDIQPTLTSQNCEETPVSNGSVQKCAVADVEATAAHVARLEESHRRHIVALESLCWAHFERLLAFRAKSHDAAFRRVAASAGSKDLRDSDLLSYAGHLRSAPDQSMLDELRAEKQRLQGDVEAARQENESLRMELGARIEYNESICSEGRKQLFQVTGSYQRRRQEISASERLADEDQVRMAAKQTEARVSERLEQQHDTLKFIKKYGDYKRNIDNADALREKTARISAQIKHLRRGYKHSKPKHEEPRSENRVSPFLRKDGQSEALIEIFNLQQEKRRKLLESRVSSSERAAAHREATIAEANMIRSTRQHQKSVEDAARAAELERFNESREAFHKERALHFLDHQHEHNACIALSEVHMMERVELVQKLQAERTQVERMLAEELKTEVRDEQTKIKAQLNVERDARRKSAAGHFADKAREKHDLRNEILRLRTERHLLEKDLHREQVSLNNDQKKLEDERDALKRQNEVLAARIALAARREAMAVSEMSTQLRRQVLTGERSSQPTAKSARGRRVLAMMYGHARNAQTPHPSLQNGLPEDSSGEKHPRAQSTLPEGHLRSPTIRHQQTEKMSVLPDPVERRSLAFPTRSEIRKRENTGGASPTMIRFAKRILELEDELREKHHPHMCGSSERSEEGLRRLTERSLEQDARTYLTQQSASLATRKEGQNTAAPGSSCGSRLYNLSSSSREQPQISLSSKSVTAKSTEQAVEHFYTEAIASHEKVLDSANRRVLRSSCVAKSPLLPLPHIMNTTDRLLYSPIHNQRLSAVDAEPEKHVVPDSEFVERFFLKGIEQERLWTKTLVAKYGLEDPVHDS